MSANTRSLVAISVGSFIYAALLLTEATGLWLGRRWAEYFTIIVTGSFVPLEIYEVSRRVTATRLAAIALNVAIVLYLMRRLRATGDLRRAPASGDS